jgi:hypothetical protein
MTTLLREIGYELREERVKEARLMAAGQRPANKKKKKRR